MKFLATFLLLALVAYSVTADSTQGSEEPPRVFLGGSCNPTTWRKDKAIKFLEGKFSYYNPQVDDWTPDLQKKEDEAKKNAEVLFIVLDNETRATASMVEVAYALGRGEPIALVVKPYQSGGEIAGEKMTEKEYEELKQGQNLVATLSKRHGITVFSDIDLALKDTATKLNNGVYRRIKDKVKKNKKAVDKRPHLFHIPPVKRSLVDMINAAYSAGKGEKVIVCIENVPTGATIEGESLSAVAVKDYNRGRSYVADAVKLSGNGEISCEKVKAA